MWQAMCCGLGTIYYQALFVCVVLSIIVGIRAAVYLQYPKPVVRETDAAHWKFRGCISTARIPRLFVRYAAAWAGR
jgi:hypothetical protein